MKSKKAQAAMEFLMTYGWMILIVLVAIGALYYLGVFSPGKYLPSKCELPPGFSCMDHKVNATDISLYIGQGLGKSINITNITFSGGVTCTGITPATPFTMNSGDEQNIALSGCSGYSGDTFNEEITIAYTDLDTGYTHTATGSIIAQIE